MTRACAEMVTEAETAAQAAHEVTKATTTKVTAMAVTEAAAVAATKARMTNERDRGSITDSIGEDSSTSCNTRSERHLYGRIDMIQSVLLIFIDQLCSAL